MLLYAELRAEALCGMGNDKRELDRLMSEGNSSGISLLSELHRGHRHEDVPY